MEPCCRLCLGTNNLIPIFDEFGTSAKLQKKLLNRLHIFVVEDDVLPKTICVLCCGQLEKFESFLKKSHKTQCKLLKILQKERNFSSNVPDTATAQSCPSSMTTSFSDTATVLSHPTPMTTDEMITESGIHKEKNEVDTIDLSNDDPGPSPEGIDLTTDINSDMDDDVEVIESDIMPLPQSLERSINYDAKENEFGNVFHDALNDLDVKFTKLDKNNQIGTPLIEYQRLLERKFLVNYPQIPFEEACIHTVRYTDKGEEISTNKDSDKGVQVQTTCRYKEKTKQELTRLKWSAEQKRILKERLSYNYSYGTLPAINDIINFLETAGPLFDDIGHDRVKQFFYNRHHYVMRSKKSGSKRNSFV